MTGRIVSSAVTCGLLVSLCTCSLPAPLLRNPGSPPRAQALHIAANQGDAEAQYNLGVAYDTGEGVPQDYAEAVRWYRLAADQGYAPAQYNLGISYATSEGVPLDWVAAHMWLSLAAAQASAEDRDRFAKARDAAAAEMTSKQIAEAQRLAREWKPTVEP